MNVESFTPCPVNKESFHLSRVKFIPETAGCYALTTFNGLVLYVGLAKNLRRRMHNHLNDPVKTTATSLGRAVSFNWFASSETNKIERTWLNIHLEHEGVFPILNKVYSPTSV
jgi:excinuclease UvrABC nuclease subunit